MTINELNGIENSMLRPCVHNEREDGIRIDEAIWVYPEDLENEEVPTEERLFQNGEIVTIEGIRCRVLTAKWESWEDQWLYECEPIEECEWAWTEAYENELSAI